MDAEVRHTNRRLVFASLSCVVLVGIGLAAEVRPPKLDEESQVAARVRSADDPFDGDFYWSGGDSVLFQRARGNQQYFVSHDMRTGLERNLTKLNALIQHAHVDAAGITFSRDGQWAMLPADPRSLMCTIDGETALKCRSNLMRVWVGNRHDYVDVPFAFKPGGPLFARVTDAATQSSGEVWNCSSYNTLSAHTNREFVCVSRTNDFIFDDWMCRDESIPWVETSSVNVDIASLAQKAAPVRSYSIAFEANAKIHSVAYSPDGKRVAIMVVRGLPRFSAFLFHMFPRLWSSRQRRDELVVCSLDGTNSRTLGYMETEADAPNDSLVHYLCWSPDQQYLGYMYRGQLRTVRVDP